MRISDLSSDVFSSDLRLTEFAEGHGLARLSIDEGYGAQTRWEPEPVTVSFGGVSVPFPPFAFLQATADGEAALVEAAQAVTASAGTRSEEHTSELQSLMRTSSAVFCLKKKNTNFNQN